MSAHIVQRRSFLKTALLLPLASLSRISEASENNRVAYSDVKNPQPPTSNGKTEVLEFFSYTCPHCFNLEKTIGPWAKKLPKDAVFNRVPVSFSLAMQPFAKIYYTLKDMGILSKYHESVFKAFQIDRIPLNEEPVLFRWVASQGIDAKKFEGIYRLKAIEYQMEKANNLAELYDINAVPTIIVGGRYQTSVAQAGSPESLIKTINELITLSKK